MSDGIIALIIPVVAIAIIFAWVPLLNFIFPPKATKGEKVLHRQHSAGTQANNRPAASSRS